MAKAFAAQADLGEKDVVFSRLSEHAYAFAAAGDPNTGIVIGDNAVMVIDAQATPRTAQIVIEKVRSVTDKPVKYVVLTSFHAVRTLGSSAYGAEHVVCSEATREMIVERGAQDYKSELQRLPRLFQAADGIPGLTSPTLTFTGRLTVWLGRLQVEIVHAGRGHTKGDTIVWLPEERTLFAGELVQSAVVPDAGDAQLKDWPGTLQKLRELRPEALLPGRGDAAVGADAVEEAMGGTQAYVEGLYRLVADAVEAGATLKQAYDEAAASLGLRYGKWAMFEAWLPFNVSRAYDEAKGLDHPRIWTPERDLEVWAALEPQE
jgi:glyoxylase-like metal-dependent hydrolase (beta-lactamase superfamily II)